MRSSRGAERALGGADAPTSLCKQILLVCVCKAQNSPCCLAQVCLDRSLAQQGALKAKWMRLDMRLRRLCALHLCCLLVSMPGTSSNGRGQPPSAAPLLFF